MNNTLFEQAGSLYEQKDYRGALRKYTACLKDTTAPFELGEIGLIYHRIGNCLVKLKNPNEAIKSYMQAASDPSYAAKGALENNIGMAYASLRDYGNAVVHFEKAVEDPAYDSPYKAYMGLGNAQLKLGKNAEAGVAFREAALDEGNPEPAKALLNLGVCFMALGRPEDAIASYASALDFEMSPDTSNRLYASMGQAYAANDQFQEAVDAFTKATADGTYLLSDSASVDYQRSISGVARTADEETLADLTDTSGLDVSVTGEHFFEEDEGQDPFYYTGEFNAVAETYPGYIDPTGTAEDRFFNATDDELEQWSKGLAKKERKRRNVGLKVLIVIIVLIVLALAAAAFAYTQGYGWPTQDTVVKQLFADPQAAATELFSDALSEESIQSTLAPVVQDSDVQIDGVNRSMSESSVFATATTEEGGQIIYKVSLVRDLIGWKVSGVELYFPSQNS